MAKVRRQNNVKFLPHLAITVLVLSFALVSYDRIAESSESLRETPVEGQVLSDRDEKVPQNARERMQVAKENKEKARNKVEVNVRKVGDDRNAGEVYEIKSEDFVAVSELPIVIDPKTSELRTVQGENERVLTVLPNQAVDVLSQNENVKLVDDMSLVENENREVEYKTRAVESKKFLGLFNVGISKEYSVSADNASVKSKPTSLLYKIFDLLSF